MDSGERGTPRSADSLTIPKIQAMGAFVRRVKYSEPTTIPSVLRGAKQPRWESLDNARRNRHEIVILNLRTLN